MKTCRKKPTEVAVVGVVTAVLLIGLIVAVVSLVQTIYIPKVMEQREAEHMDKVAEQFTYLTSVIDGQAADQKKNLPIATSITLGSKELPYMLSVKAFGKLEILEESCWINVTNSSSAKTFPIGTVTYSSINSYFLDQSYTYEAGAMIVSQIEEGNLMMIRPSFLVTYQSPQTLHISFDVVNISSIGQKTIATGFGTYPIQTEFDTISSNDTFSNVRYMNFSTPNANAWAIYLNQSLKAADPTLGSIVKKTAQGVELNFSAYDDVTIVLRVIEIRAQIGPGWVEQ